VKIEFERTRSSARYFFPFLPQNLMPSATMKSSESCASSRALPVSSTIVWITRSRFRMSQRRSSVITSSRPSQPIASQPGCARRARAASSAT
jgi:hypothetical protein